MNIHISIIVAILGAILTSFWWCFKELYKHSITIATLESDAKHQSKDVAAIKSSITTIMDNMTKISESMVQMSGVVKTFEDALKIIEQERRDELNERRRS